MKTLEEIREIAYSWEGPKSICYCEHSGDGSPSYHEDEIRERLMTLGHGRCIARGCGCTKFTWKKYTPEFNEAMK